MTYHITGLISALIFLLTAGGLWSQLQFVWGRQREFTAGAHGAERPTAVLSLNQFVSSFLAFYSFFIYGAGLARFNHYLVWPRLAASLFTLVLLWEILRDRRDRDSCPRLSASGRPHPANGPHRRCLLADAPVLSVEGHLHHCLRAGDGPGSRMAVAVAVERERGGKAHDVVAFPLGAAQPAGRATPGGGRAGRDGWVYS